MRFETRDCDDFDLGPHDDAPARTLRLVGADADVHAEDAFLREFDEFLRKTLHLSREDRAFAHELAREALDRVDGVDGDFATLAIEGCLASAVRTRGVTERVDRRTLALAFVTFLRTSDRLAPVSARRMRRCVLAMAQGTTGHAHAA